MKTLFLSACIAIAFTGNAIAAPKNKKEPEFSSKSYLVAYIDGTIISEKASADVRPIASITKLMVGLLAAEQDMDEQLPIPKSRTVQSSIPPNVPTLSRKELLSLSMVKSDNFASQILCNNIPNCIEEMNRRAQDLGMVNTHFNEPTGLDKGNVSNAQDLLKLMIVASSNSILSDLSSRPTLEIPTSGKPIKVRNTNPLTSKLQVTLSKTGFTNPAGGCLVMIMNSPAGQKIFILLGSRNTRTRIPDMERLVRGI